jgi:hypothetical protein
MNEEQDAAIRVNVVPPGLDPTTSLAGLTITANQPGAVYQWLDCNNSFAVVGGATSQNYTATLNGSYACQISFAGCLDTSACVVINTVGMEETLMHNALVYPNPGESFLNIQMLTGINAKDISIQITDVAGKVMEVPYQLNAEILRLNLDGISNGIYTYRIAENNNVIAVGKFVKQ